MTTHSNRRVFILTVAASGCGLATSQALAQATPVRVDEADEQAVALGYKHDTRKVDKARYPNHSPAQTCANCSFWQGAATDPWAGCAMFGRKHIANAGWCQVWAKKPG